MAIYHLSVKTVNRSTGRSAVAASAYRARTELENLSTGEVHNYTKKTDHRETWVMTPENVPEEMKNLDLLWSMAEEKETRKNANTAREVEVALPLELSEKDQKKLVGQFVDINFVSKGMIAQVSIHEGKKENPHAHIMLTTREYDLKQNHFGKKGTGWDKKSTLKEWRESWADGVNFYLNDIGYDKSHLVDHRTLKAQGIDRPAQIHQGPIITAMKKDGIETNISRHNEMCKNIELDQKKSNLNRHRSIKKGLDKSDNSIGYGW